MNNPDHGVNRQEGKWWPKNRLTIDAVGEGEPLTLTDKYSIHESLVQNLTSIEEQLGNIVEDKFRSYGFSVYSKENKELIHFSGYIVRDKQPTEFSIDTDLNHETDKVHLLQYKL